MNNSKYPTCDTSGNLNLSIDYRSHIDCLNADQYAIDAPDWVTAGYTRASNTPAPQYIVAPALPRDWGSTP